MPEEYYLKASQNPTLGVVWLEKIDIEYGLQGLDKKHLAVQECRPRIISL